MYYYYYYYYIPIQKNVNVMTVRIPEVSVF